MKTDNSIIRAVIARASAQRARGARAHFFQARARRARAPERAISKRAPSFFEVNLLEVREYEPALKFLETSQTYSFI